jgi:hypothetical protein
MLICFYGEFGGAHHTEDGDDNEGFCELVSTAFEEPKCRRESQGKYKDLPRSSVVEVTFPAKEMTWVAQRVMRSGSSEAIVG